MQTSRSLPIFGLGVVFLAAVEFALAMLGIALYHDGRLDQFIDDSTSARSFVAAIVTLGCSAFPFFLFGMLMLAVAQREIDSSKIGVSRACSHR